MTRWLALVWLGSLLACAVPAHADPHVRVVARFPASDVLAPGDSLYLKVEYQSSRPLRLQLNAEGPDQVKAGAMMNASPAYPAGSGEAIVWIAFRQPYEPEQLILRVADERWRTLQEIPLNDNARWVAGQPSSGTRAEWADTLGQQQQRLIRENIEQSHASNSGSDGLLSLLLFLMAWSIPGYLVLQVLVWRRWHDGWRKAGLLPLWVSIPVTGYSIFALLMGSNLWPLMMLFVLPVLFVYLLLLALLRRLRQS